MGDDDVRFEGPRERVYTSKQSKSAIAFNFKLLSRGLIADCIVPLKKFIPRYSLLSISSIQFLGRSDKRTSHAAAASSFASAAMPSSVIRPNLQLFFSGVGIRLICQQVLY